MPLTEAVRGIDVILASNARIDADVIAAADRVRLIQQPAAGIDGIDIDAARTRGVPVCNAPGTNHVSVAEIALFLMLALARRLPRAQTCLAERRLGVPLGIELRGKPLGIIGMGRSGQALAELAEALGMVVLSVRSTSESAEWRALYTRADVISLHCPLTDKTRGLLDRTSFEMMKPGVLIVNCARGPIIDRPALEAALDSGQVGGAALDTVWHEPWDPGDPLGQRENVIILPHVAGSTAESLGRIADIVCENVVRVERGDEPLHRVA